MEDFKDLRMWEKAHEAMVLEIQPMLACRVQPLSVEMARS
jgi:hypothetical protein